jgi:hypothetical protein
LDVLDDSYALPTLIREVFIDGSYGSKARIIQVLYDKRPKYV